MITPNENTSVVGGVVGKFYGISIDHYFIAAGLYLRMMHADARYCNITFSQQIVTVKFPFFSQTISIASEERRLLVAKTFHRMRQFNFAILNYVILD